jgi:hypothetical protein
MRTVTLALSRRVVDGSWAISTGKVALPSSPTAGKLSSGMRVASPSCSSARPK